MRVRRLESAMHLGAASDSLGPILLGLAVILVAAKLGGEAAARLKQPTVVGEIVVGILLGNVALLGLPPPEFLRGEVLDVLAELGILLLLFQVGVEATVPQLMRTGVAALGVAVVGVVAPLGLGIAVSWAFFPGASIHMHAFVGAILCATSIGLTARVLQDLRRTRTPEALLILGAAVIDDVLALVLLATVSGLVTAAETGVAMGVGRIALLVGQAVLFLVVSIPLGLWLAPRVFRAAGRWRSKGLLLPLGLAFCFLLAYVATLVGLAPIVGAFTAGLILEDAHFVDLARRERRTLEELLEPLTAFLLPVFFVLIGMKVDASRFADPLVLLFAAALTVAAVAGKLACAFAVPRGVDRLAVGIGMVPRGEVGFIFAAAGASLTLGGQPLVSKPVFAAAILVVIATTLVVPPALAARLNRLPPPPEDAPEGRTVRSSARSRSTRRRGRA